jgi:uncharacterized membrane protein (DUF373 family)
MRKDNITSTLKFYDIIVGYAIDVLIIYIIIIIMIGLLKVLYPLNILFDQYFSKFNLSQAVTDILTFLVMIELFRGFVDYLKVKRISLHSMIDPAIIFIFRELIEMLYSPLPLSGKKLVGFTALLLALGAVR